MYGSMHLHTYCTVGTHHRAINQSTINRSINQPPLSSSPTLLIDPGPSVCLSGFLSRILSDPLYSYTSWPLSLACRFLAFLRRCPTMYWLPSFCCHRHRAVTHHHPVHHSLPTLAKNIGWSTLQASGRHWPRREKARLGARASMDVWWRRTRGLRALPWISRYIRYYLTVYVLQ